MIGTLAQLKEIFHCPVRVGDEKIDVQSISTDTRTIGPSAVFLALKGDVFDGHDYAKKILEAGALGIIVEQGRFAWAVGNPKVIEVPNTLEAYGKVAKAYRIAKGFKVVGITGSSGKTTTKDMVAQVLGYRFKVEKTQRNNNNEIGLPLTILSASEDTEILVLEMGMRKLGEIAYLTALAQPNYGVITNIGVAHLGELGSKENILQAKGELLEGLPSGSIGLINGEDGYDQELISRASVPVRIFGFGENASIQAINLVSEDGMSRFSLKRDGKTIACVLPFVGKHLILDSLIAIEVGLHFGISIEEGIEALSQLKTAPGRLHPLWIKGALFIDDSYNANPQSMKSSIEILGTYHGNKIAFLGDMRELGTDEASFHREVGQYLVEKGISTLFVLGELGKEIGVGFLQAGGSKDNLHICPSIEVAGQEISDIIKDGDTVLVKGSRAMTMEKVFQYVGR